MSRPTTTHITITIPLDLYETWKNNKKWPKLSPICERAIRKALKDDIASEGTGEGAACNSVRTLSHAKSNQSADAEAKR